MERKYIIVFLTGLLCLVSSGELFSQHCFKMSYDKNGNMISFEPRDCKKDMRGNETYDMLEKDVEKHSDELLVYPNPNNGIFKIKLENKGQAEVSIYDNKGVLINSQRFSEEVDVDITNNQAGAYLLRIIEDDNVRSVIVVKL